MGLSPRLFRVPRPQTFLYIMSLQTGATLITLSLLLNKVSGLYGLIVVLTGFHLSPFQLSMYVYSIIALALAAFLAPHIQKQSPLQCLALAWFYLIDSVINAGYTAFFAMTWFLFISQHHNSAPTSGPGSTMGDAAGFTNPKYNVSSVHVVPEKEAESAAEPASAPAGTKDNSTRPPSLENGVLQPEGLESIGIICTLWLIRVYFVLVMLAFARQCLRQHAFNRLTSSTTGTSRSGSVTHTRDSSLASAPHSRSSSVTIPNVALDPKPFSPRFPEGQGWKGRLGRAMVSLGRSYWLEGDTADDDGWMAGMNRKFRTSRPPPVGGAAAAQRGVSERERRRRSGTGPPAPSKSVLNSVQSSHSHSHSHNPYYGFGVDGGQSDDRERDA